MTMMLCPPNPVINHWGGAGNAGSRSHEVGASFSRGTAVRVFRRLDKEGPTLCWGHVVRVRPPGTQGTRATTVPSLGRLAGLWDPALSLRALRVTCSPDVPEGVCGSGRGHTAKAATLHLTKGRTSLSTLTYLFGDLQGREKRQVT